MKKRFILCALLFTVSFYGFSQNPGIVPDALPGAFTDYIYNASDLVPTATEKYTQNNPVPKLSIPLNVNNAKEDLYLDIYTANNSYVCLDKKPLIVFLPGTSRNKGEYEFIAKDLARRGYVVASISYRSYSLNSTQQDLLNTSAVHPYLVFTSAMDAQIAIKYLISNATRLKIDPNYVIIGGGSFGACNALAATFASKSEIAAKFPNNTSSISDIYDPYFNDFDDFVGTNTIKGVISLYGGIYYTDWIQASEKKPVFIYHGNKDLAVPYKNEKLFYMKSATLLPFPPFVFIADNIIVSGGADIAQKLKSNNSSFCFISASEVGHTYAPKCGYMANEFPNGYPINWYPDMLRFLKNSVLCNNLNQTSKTINCFAPDCDMDDAGTLNHAQCRVASSDPGFASNNATNSSIPTIVSLPITACQPSTVNEHCHAFSFDGGDYVRVPSSTTLQNSNNSGFTVEFWFKKNISNPSNTVITFFQNLKGQLKDTPFLFGLKGNDNLWISDFSDWGISYSRLINIPAIDNNWHHYKINFGGLPNTINVKIDNNSYIFTNFLIETTNFTAWNFGGRNSLTENSIDNNTMVGCNGQMDDIKIWKGIAAFNANTTNAANICPNQTDLLAYYKLNGDGQVVEDQTNNNNDGVKGETTAVESSDPTYVSNCNTSARMANGNVAVNPAPANEKDITVGNNGKEVLSLYPNPSSDKPNVAFVAEEQGIGTLEITDMNGNILVQNTNIQYKNGLTLLSSYLPPLAGGMYLLKFKTLTHAYSQKFTIIH